MFRKISSSGLICILHADNTSPLKLWEKKIRDGRLKRVTDPDIRGLTLDFTGKVPYVNHLRCPADEKAQLGIKYPYLMMTARSSDSNFFAFDVQILDDSGTRRRFRFVTGGAVFEIQPFYCRIPLILEPGWNNIVIPLHFLTKEVYASKFVEILRIQLYPSCVIKKIYFTDRDYGEEELPREFQFSQRRTPTSESHLRKNEELAKRKETPKGKAQRKPTPNQGKRSVREIIPKVIPITRRKKQSTYSST